MNLPKLDRRELRRDLRHLAPFLLIGAVINIVVAYSCARWAAIPRFHTGDKSELEEKLMARWLPRKPDSFADQHWDAGILDRGFGIRESVMLSMPETEYPTLPRPSEVFELILIEAGWPSASFVGGVWSSGSGHFEPVWAHVIDPQRVMPTITDWESIIPLKPMWSGFLINAVFFGGIMFLLVRWPQAWRRYRRASRGLCPGCAYDLGHAEHEACPECGAAAA